MSTSSPLPTIMNGNREGHPSRNTRITPAALKGPTNGPLTIIQFNCGGANHCLARPFSDSLAPETHHIIAVQEPYFNTKSKSTYTPPGYHLFLHPDMSSWVCFMVSKSININAWECRRICEDIVALTLNTVHGPIDVINVYNPKPATTRSWTPSRLGDIQR